MYTPVCAVGLTWTYVQEAHRRCRPMDGGTDPVSASSGPGNDLKTRTDTS